MRPYFERPAVVHVATLMPDGSPHSVPVWIGLEGDELAFFMTEGSRKDENLQRDPRIAFSVTDPDEPLSMAFVRGSIGRRVGGDEAQEIVDRISRKYSGKNYDVRSGLVVHLTAPATVWSHDYSDE